MGLLHKHKGHELVFDDDEKLDVLEAADCVSLEEGFVSTKDLGTCNQYRDGTGVVSPEDFGCNKWKQLQERKLRNSLKYGRDSLC